MGGISPPTMTRPNHPMVIRLLAANASAISPHSPPPTGRMKSTEFDLLAFIESQQRGGLIVFSHQVIQ